MNATLDTQKSSAAKIGRNSSIGKKKNSPEFTSNDHLNNTGLVRQAYNDMKNVESLTRSLSPNEQKKSIKGERPDSQLKKRKVPQGFITNISIEKSHRITSPMARSMSKNKNYDVEDPRSMNNRTITPDSQLRQSQKSLSRYKRP